MKKSTLLWHEGELMMGEYLGHTTKLLDFHMNINSNSTFLNWNTFTSIQIQVAEFQTAFTIQFWMVHNFGEDIHRPVCV